MKLRGKLLSGFSVVIMLFTLLLGYTIFKINQLSVSILELKDKAPQFDEVIQRVDNLQNKVYPVFEQANLLVKKLKDVQDVFVNAISDKDLDVLENITAPADAFFSLSREMMLNLNDSDAKELKFVENAFSDYVSSGKEAVKVFLDGKNVDLGLIGKVAQELNQKIEKLHDNKKREFVNGMNKISSSSQEFKEDLLSVTSNTYRQVSNVNTIIPILSIIGLIGGITIATLLTKFVFVKPIQEIVDIMQDIAEGEGDLTRKLDDTRPDELGVLAKSFNIFIEKLHGIIEKLKTMANDVNSSTNEISTSVEEQLSITTEQSGSVSEITSTMEELLATSTQIADNSQSVVGVSTNALQVAEDGVGMVETVKKKIGEININNQNSISEILELGTKSKEISKVMEIINDIADQTKLIAFNAALEASSAGEAGKRFGVVATEIRRLADNVMESTGDIKSKIDEIQQAVNRLVLASEKGSKGIDEGVELTSQTANVLKDILTGAQSTTEAAKQISLSTRQQKTASNQVVISLKEISQGAKHSSDSFQQISSVAVNLSDLSNNLRKIIGKFKLNTA